MVAVRKKPILQHFLFPLVAVTIFLFSSIAQAIPFSKKQEILSLIDQKMRVDGIPGASFAVVRQGQLEWAAGLGLGNVEHALPASADTVYRAASIVKPITATAILQLYQAGQIDLDEPVWSYCSEFPEKLHLVTIRQLLSHTAGVRSYSMPWSKFEAELYSAKRYKTVTGALSIFSNDALIHKPGSAYKYTSYGYNLLGCVIESVTDLSYEEYIDRNILQPSAMESTIAERSEDIVYNRAGLYSKDKKGKLANAKYVDLTNKIPSGGMLSTATDMARFASAYLNGKLLPLNLIKQTHQPVKLLDGTLSYYGLGWDTKKVKPENRSREMYHVGVTPGVTAIMYLYPETKGAVIIFTNLYNVSGIERLAQSIGKMANLHKTPVYSSK